MRLILIQITTDLFYSFAAANKKSLSYTVTIASVKYHDINQSGEERIHLAHTSTSPLFITGGIWDENSNRVETGMQEFVLKPRKDTSYCLVFHGSLSVAS